MKNIVTKDIILTIAIGFIAGTSAGVIVTQFQHNGYKTHEGQVMAQTFNDLSDKNPSSLAHNQNAYLPEQAGVYSEFQSDMMAPADLYNDEQDVDFAKDGSEKFQNI